MWVLSNSKLGSKMADAFSPFSVIDDAIMTSLLLLKVIYYMLANLLILSNTLVFRYFSLNCTLRKFGICQ